jgi:GT2 family glycosyltransferase
MTRTCLDNILANTDYTDFEVILVDNWSTDPRAADFRSYAKNTRNVRILDVKEQFNYARLNNLASRETRAKYLLFMNNDVFVTQRDWMRLLVDEAVADARVGAVGAKLLYPDGTVQHGGIILGVAGVGNHAYRGRPADDPWFMGRGICAQELSAVTAALMLCPLDVFRAIGGFDEKDLAVAYNDVDLCLKLRARGCRVIWTPAVMAEHHESVSRDDDMKRANLSRFVYEERTMFARWGEVIRRDSFYSRHFSTESGIFSHLSKEPLEISGSAEYFTRSPNGPRQLPNWRG